MQAQAYNFLPLSSSSPIRSRSRTTTTTARLRVSAAATSLAAPSAATMYELLSVKESAGPGEIKAAFRKLARKLHPDTCRSSEGEERKQMTQQFIMAREAYRVLSDPVLREDYDCRLKNGWVLSHKSPMTRKNGFGDWESQLEELMRRSSVRESTSSSWGRRMRAASAAASQRN
ncbi:chaperone protein dnaJ 20, chloroplastic-like protein [Cinnamomum micranthum f. kanehirae]|uniref:Chaperone protein dnaJ 20, chloroplastic-like protein n=1 Tax=Cinnamomum micranthum f. kanehirae TaxID=337451 RepID=A0A3S3M0I3_9MAGN|nr:chaperone protein dnaJ 20, chloroplastic-like protein [Cinnamomum micranthum f. kanehirae]